MEDSELVRLALSAKKENDVWKRAGGCACNLCLVGKIRPLIHIESGCYTFN